MDEERRARDERAQPVVVERAGELGARRDEPTREVARRRPYDDPAHVAGVRDRIDEDVEALAPARGPHDDGGRARGRGPRRPPKRLPAPPSRRRLAPRGGIERVRDDPDERVGVGMQREHVAPRRLRGHDDRRGLAQVAREPSTVDERPHAPLDRTEADERQFVNGDDDGHRDAGEGRPG